MHHGAGSSGLSFAACAGEIRKILPKAGILSLDCRDHGSTRVTKSTDDSRVEMDLTLETLSRDLVFVIRETQSKLGWGQDLPDIVLVGHSLGGAVVTDVAKQGGLGQKVLAYAVLDVVEGTYIYPLFLSCANNVAHAPLQALQWTLSRVWRNTFLPDQIVSRLLHRE